jgi:hypothetical protein
MGARGHYRIGLAVDDPPAVVIAPIDHRDAKCDTAEFVTLAHFGLDSFDVEHVAEV